VLFLLPFLFIKHVPARYLVLAQVLNTVVAYLVFVAEGNQVTRLFGIGHFFWIVPWWMLAKDVSARRHSVLYRSYAVIAVVTMTISLVFDVRDTAQWILGERESVLVNVPEESALSKYAQPG
jgi:hypothetical protein